MTRICKAGLSGAVAGMVWLGLSLSDSAYAEQLGEPRTVVETFLAAVNEGDMVKVRSLLADDYQVLRRGAECPQTSDPVQCELAWIESQWVKDNAQLKTIDLRSEREVVRVSLAVSGDSIRASGADRILLTKEFIVENGRIQSMLPTLHNDDPQTAEYRKSTTAFR